MSQNPITAPVATADSATGPGLRDRVREHYAAAARRSAAGQADPARQVEATSCGIGTCGTTADDAVFGGGLYSDEAHGAPATAASASPGCGVPTAVAELHPGETVLDLDFGAGTDVLISASRVGPEGRAIGMDMPPEMLGLARRNAAQAGDRARLHTRRCPMNAAPITPAFSSAGLPEPEHVRLPVATLLACAVCCMVRFLGPLVLLTAAAIITATTGLLVLTAIVPAAAAVLWLALNWRTRRTEPHRCSGRGCFCD